MPDTYTVPAYLIATINIKTLETVRIRCYSSPANMLAVHDSDHRFVDIARAYGTSFGDAVVRMERWLADSKSRITWAA